MQAIIIMGSISDKVWTERIKEGLQRFWDRK
jgi:hypothetical protein